MSNIPPADKPPRPIFKLSGVASVKHLNVRKEGPEDDKVLAIDVKLIFTKVDRRLCAYFDEALEAFLWRGDTDALITRNGFMAPVAYLNEIYGACVTIGGREFVGCDVKKFSLQPADGGVMTLVCSVSLYPYAEDVSQLAAMVQDEERVKIEGPPDLFAPPDDEPDNVFSDLPHELVDAVKEVNYAAGNSHLSIARHKPRAEGTSA